MDAEYLKASVGEVLAAGLAAVSVAQPKDAVEYLGLWLKRHVENDNRQKKLSEVAESISRRRKEEQEVTRALEKEKEQRRLEELQWLKAISQMSDEDTTDLFAAVFAAIKNFTRAANAYYAVVVKAEPASKEGDEEAGDDEQGQDEADDIDNTSGISRIKGKPGYVPGPLKYVAATKENGFMIGKMLQLEQGVSHEALQKGSYLHVPNVLEEPRVHFFRQRRQGAFLALPVMGADGLYRELLACDTLTPGRPFSEQEINFIQELGRAIQSALEKRDSIRRAAQDRLKKAKDEQEERERREREEATRLLEEKISAELGDIEDADDEAAEQQAEEEQAEEGIEQGEGAPVDENDEARALLRAINNRIFELDMKKVAAELRTYNVPPPGVHNTLKAMLAILGYRKSDLDEWSTTRAYVGQDLLVQIERYDPFVKQPKANRLFSQRAIKGISQQDIEKSSKAAALFFEWVKVTIALRKQAIAARKAQAAVARDQEENGQLDGGESEHADEEDA